MASQAIIANQRSAGEGGVDISKADATPLDVFEGKTFFSSLSKELQTGTMTAANLVKFASGVYDIPRSNDGSVKTFTVTGLGFEPKMVGVRVERRDRGVEANKHWDAIMMVNIGGASDTGYGRGGYASSVYDQLEITNDGFVGLYYAAEGISLNSFTYHAHWYAIGF